MGIQGLLLGGIRLINELTSQSALNSIEVCVNRKDLLQFDIHSNMLSKPFVHLIACHYAILPLQK